MRLSEPTTDQQMRYLVKAAPYPPKMSHSSSIKANVRLPHYMPLKPVN